jgi:hypothetical protein
MYKKFENIIDIRITKMDIHILYRRLEVHINNYVPEIELLDTFDEDTQVTLIYYWRLSSKYKCVTMYNKNDFNGMKVFALSLGLII